MGSSPAYFPKKTTIYSSIKKIKSLHLNKDVVIPAELLQQYEDLRKWKTKN